MQRLLSSEEIDPKVNLIMTVFQKTKHELVEQPRPSI